MIPVVLVVIPQQVSVVVVPVAAVVNGIILAAVLQLVEAKVIQIILI